MAISITPASVVTVAGTGESSLTGVAGATITAGMTLYIDTANSSVLKPADANLSLLASTVAGIALHGASTGQPIKYQTAGNITIGGTVVAGTIYVCGATTAGDIEPASALTAGWYTSILGVATTAAIIKLGINNSGVSN